MLQQSEKQTFLLILGFVQCILRLLYGGLGWFPQEATVWLLSEIVILNSCKYCAIPD